MVLVSCLNQLECKIKNKVNRLILDLMEPWAFNFSITHVYDGLMCFYHKHPCTRPRWVSLVNPFFRIFSSTDRSRAHIQLSAAYSLISGWDTEVKQYNSCLLRPLPRDRGCTEEGIIVDLLYLVNPISIRHPFRFFSLSPSLFFLSNSLSWYVDTHRRNDATAFIIGWDTMRSILVSVLVVFLLSSLSFFSLVLPVLRTEFLGLCGVIHINNAISSEKCIY